MLHWLHVVIVRVRRLRTRGLCRRGLLLLRVLLPGCIPTQKIACYCLRLLLLVPTGTAAAAAL